MDFKKIIFKTHINTECVQDSNKTNVNTGVTYTDSHKYSVCAGFKIININTGVTYTNRQELRMILTSTETPEFHVYGTPNETRQSDTFSGTTEYIHQLRQVLWSPRASTESDICLDTLFKHSRAAQVVYRPQNRTPAHEHKKTTAVGAGTTEH
jgi:hypothetical protein